MNENYKNNAKSSTPEQDATLYGSLKVAWVAGLLSTLGDALGTYAASLAIEEAIEEEILQNKKDEQLEKKARKSGKAVRDNSKHVGIEIN